MKFYRNTHDFYLGNFLLTSMHDVLSLQFHGEGFSCSSLWPLWPFITLLKLGREIQLTLKLLRLKNSWNWCNFGNLFFFNLLKLLLKFKPFIYMNFNKFPWKQPPPKLVGNIFVFSSSEALKHFQTVSNLICPFLCKCQKI